MIPKVIIHTIDIPLTCTTKVGSCQVNIQFNETLKPYQSYNQTKLIGGGGGVFLNASANFFKEPPPLENLPKDELFSRKSKKP